MKTTSRLFNADYLPPCIASRICSAYSSGFSSCWRILKQVRMPARKFPHLLTFLQYASPWRSCTRRVCPWTSGRSFFMCLPFHSAWKVSQSPCFPCPIRADLARSQICKGYVYAGHFSRPRPYLPCSFSSSSASPPGAPSPSGTWSPSSRTLC